MATTAQIKRGLGAFIGSEIMPNIPGGSIKRMAIGTVLDLFLDNIEHAMSDDGMLLPLLGIKNANGEIDINKVAEHLKKNIPDEGVRFELKALGFRIGDMTLRRYDVDTLLQHINAS